MVFLVYNERSITYEQLLFDLNSSDQFTEYYQSNDLYLFLRNLLTALLHNKNLTLIDSDTKTFDIPQEYLSLLNQITRLSSSYYSSVDAMLAALIQSQSKISLFTSGTTGQPKIISHSVKTLSRFVKRGTKFSDNIWGLAYNPSHIAGLQVFFQALLNKNPIINLFGESRQNILKNIKSNSITHISATPTFYRNLLPSEEPLLSVKRITFGGEKSDGKLYEAVRTLFPNAKVTNIYASTEAGSLLASDGDYFSIPSEFKDTILIRDNELWVHKSLLGQSDTYQFVGDYYKSNDLIEWIDQQRGVFRFIGRKNELINIGGYKVNPSEIESVLKEHPNIKDAIVYGRANALLGNILVSELIMVNNEILTELEIRRYLSARFQDFKIPRVIKFVNSFNYTRSGKVKKG